MLSSFMLRDDDFFFEPSFGRRMTDHRAPTLFSGGFFDRVDVHAPFRHDAAIESSQVKSGPGAYSAWGFSQVTTRDGKGTGTQETRRSFSDSTGQFKREHDQAIFDETSRRVAGKNRVERKLFKRNEDNDAMDTDSKAVGQLLQPPEVVTLHGVDDTEAFDKLWGEKTTTRAFSRQLRDQDKNEGQKASNEVAPLESAALSKAETEAALAVKQAERALKVARRAQREAKKNAEKLAHTSATS